MIQNLAIAKDVVDDLKNKFGDVIQSEGDVAVVNEDFIAKVCKYLKNEKGFDHLSNLSAVDLIKQNMMCVVYHLWSTEKKQLIILKAFLPRDPTDKHVCHEDDVCDGVQRLPSISKIYPAADWHEREAFDLFGIIFEGHPNMKRLLLKEDWIGHPLRKDDESGVPAYQIDWKLAMMRSNDKFVLNMGSINQKLEKMKEEKEDGK